MPRNINDVIMAAGNKYLDTAYFANAMPYPANYTYTRTGAATGRTVAGVITDFAADTPQRTDRGLVLEAANTNVLLRSREFDNASWGKANVTVTANAITAPDGTLTADKLEVTATAAATFNQSVTSAGSASGNTLIIFAKKGSGTSDANIFLLRNDTTATNLVGITFNYDTGGFTYTSGSSGVSVTAMANGWWMLVMSVSTGISAGNQLRAYVGFSGNSETAGEFMYAWGASLLTGSVLAAGVPTTTAAASRGLPVFTEAVPLGRTKALLTFADASTLLVTGLTPGGTFDVATAVIAAGKGRFSSSELTRRLWQA